MRVVLCLLFALVSTPALAEWVKVSETDEMVSYIDPATIRKDGHFRKVWQVQDLKKRDPDGEMSMRHLTEYDCKEERRRMLSSSDHSEPMADGTILKSFNSLSDWRNIAPNTPAKSVLAIVCAK